MSDESPTTVADKVFDQAQALMREEGISATQAFKRLAPEYGRSPGTLSTNYYRAARKRGLLTDRRGVAVTPESVDARTREALEALDAAEKAVGALRQIYVEQAAALAKQTAEIEKLQKLKALLAD